MRNNTVSRRSADKRIDELTRMLSSYEEYEHEEVKHIAEGLLSPNVPEKIREICEMAKTPSSRPCHHWCLTIDRAYKCKAWQTWLRTAPIGEIIDRESKSSVYGAIALFFAIHATAFERWEDSFDYVHIGCILTVARHIAARGKANAPPEFGPLFDAFAVETIRVHHQAYIENGIIADDPGAMKWHADRFLERSREEIRLLDGVKSQQRVPWLARFAEDFVVIVNRSVKYHTYLKRIAAFALLCQNDRARFHRKYQRYRKSNAARIKKLEEWKNYECASHLRAHYEILERFLEHSGEAALRLIRIDGTLMFGFHFNVEDLRIDGSVQGDGKSAASSRPILSFEEMREELNKEKQLLEFKLKDASEDPLPDILETDVSREHFENIVLCFSEVEIKKLPYQEDEPNKPPTPSSSVKEELKPILPLTLRPKLLYNRLGIGCISFEFQIDSCTVSQFQTLKNLVSPHSAMYDIACKSDSKSATVKSYGRLHELAEDIAGAYIQWMSPRYARESADEPNREGTKIQSMKSASAERRTIDAGVVSNMVWFSSYRIYKITDAFESALSLKELTRHFEWPGIVSYQRADRAGIDDWVGVSVAAQGAKNLAEIRAHRGDFFIISDTHAIIYLPDDPEFIVVQYGETARWTFLIRILVIHSVAGINRELKNLNAHVKSIEKELVAAKSDLDDSELERWRDDLFSHNMQVQRFVAMSLAAIDHIASVVVSQYPDHALLLRKTFQSTYIPKMTELLQSKIASLSTGQQMANTVLQHIQNIREKKRHRAMNGLFLILSLLGVFTVYGEVFKLIESKTYRLAKVGAIVAPSLLILCILSYTYWDKIKRWHGKRIRRRTKANGS